MTDLYHNLSSSHFFVTGTLRGLSEFDGADTATICYMHQLELLVLFTSGMEINARHRAIALVKADVIETFKARSSNRLDLVIRHQEIFFPSHEEMFALGIILA